MSAKDFYEKDYYKTLGVPKDAQPAEIKKAYRKLARQFHPDKNVGESGGKAAEDRFKAVSEAYDILSDDKTRKEYDEARALMGSGAFRRPPAGGRPGQGFDMGDLFGHQAGAGAGGLGDILGGLFGGARTGHPTAPRRGADFESEVTLGFAESVDGATVSLRMASEQACPSCHGTGGRGGSLPTQCPICLGTGQTTRNQGGFAFAEPCRECHGRGLVVEDPCPECHGSGRATGTRTLTVRIPAGVRDGQTIRLRGKGAPGEHGGPAGDLLVTVHVSPHELFGRKVDNLILSVPVTFAEAALGADIRIPTLGGSPVTLKLPPGTSNGRTFRVKGRGVTRRDGIKGDLLVTVEVVVPAKLSGKAREAVEAFQAATAAEDPRDGLFQRAGGGGS